MNPQVAGEQNGKWHCERKHWSDPPLQPPAIVFTFGARILPVVPARKGEPDKKRPERLPRRDANRADHPPDAPRKVRDDSPDRQDAREHIKETTTERNCWHSGHAMVTYAINPEGDL